MPLVHTQFSFPDGVLFKLNFEIEPNSNSQLPGQVSKFFESPLQVQNDLKCSAETANIEVQQNQNISECKEELKDDRTHHIIRHSEEPKGTHIHPHSSHDHDKPHSELSLNGKKNSKILLSSSSTTQHPVEITEPPPHKIPEKTPQTPQIPQLPEIRVEEVISKPAIIEPHLPVHSIQENVPEISKGEIEAAPSAAPANANANVNVNVNADAEFENKKVENNISLESIPITHDDVDLNGHRETKSPIPITLADKRSKSPSVSSLESEKSDRLYALASAGSRVSANLIKKLSSSNLLAEDHSVHSENSSNGAEGFSAAQPTALNWLEKQCAEEDTPTPMQEFLNGTKTPPGKSPTTLPDSGNESPYLDSSKKSAVRALFLPTHSTILEEGSRDDNTYNPNQNESNTEEKSPLINTQPRKFLSKFARTISSLTEEGDDENQEVQNVINLSPSTRKKMKRRTSISTTNPCASFDGDDEEAEEKKAALEHEHDPTAVSVPIPASANVQVPEPESDRVMSGKFSAPVITIDEYDENFFEREGEESPHGSFMRSQSGEQSIGSQPSINLSVTDNINWKKTTGAGVRKARRKNLATPTKRGRATLSTTKHVRNWDQTASAAEVARITMDERIRDDAVDEEFLEVGSTVGLEMWVVDRGLLRVLRSEEMGLFYTSDCYLILSTAEKPAKSGSNTNNNLTWSLHTWIGSHAEKDKCTIAAFKAQRLSKRLGGIRIITNLEADESNEFIEIMFGNITVVEGSTAESSLKKPSNRQPDRFADSSVRLLLVAGDHSTSLFPSLGDRAKTPALQAIPLTRENFKSTSALILDTGEDLIYQWRGGLVSQLTRARVFEAAFALRSERIKLNPKCRIEVIDEGHEPEQFWDLVDKFSNFKDDEVSIESGDRPGDSDDDNYHSDGDGSQRNHSHFDGDDDDDGLVNEDDDDISDEGSHKSAASDKSEIFYDIDDLKEYCADQMDGHAEMHRRQIISQSRILDPQAFNLKDSSLEIDAIGQNIINLYRIGYVDGHMHTSRLSGVNSEGIDFGPPKRSQLESKGVYILDFKDEVYVWIGKESDSDLRVAAMTIAKALLQHSKAEWVCAVRVMEGNEPMLFKTKFLGWHEADMQENSFRLRWNRLSISQNKSTGNEKPMNMVLNQSVNYMKHKRKRKTMLASKHRTVVRSKIAALERHAFHDILSADDGSGIAVVWKVVDSELRSLSKSEVGHFWTHEAYVILYGFTPKVVAEEEDSNEEGTPHFVIYFWQGPHTPEKAYPQWKLCILPQKKDEWIAQMGQIPPEIRVVQGREPLHFFKMFKHRYIVHFAFLTLIKHRNKAEEKVRVVQAEILKLEKLRLNNLPVPRRSYRRVSGVYSSPNSRQLLNVARSSPKTSPGSRSPLHRDGSFTSIDSSVVEDVSSHTTPIGKSFYKMETSSGVLLFQVRGSGLIDEDVHAVQIEARASRLNSSDCYIAIRPSTRGQSFVWLWVGRGTQYFEQEAAGALAIMILRWFDKDAKGNQVRVVEEGAGEWFDRWIVKSFYRALGGYSLYTNFDLLQTPRYLRPYALRYPQLFVCEHMRNEFTITMHERYCQSDLLENVAAILDAHYALFIWYGRVCSAAIKVTSLKVAKKFLGSLKKGSKSLERPVVEVLQDQEPAPFISCFHGWCDWKLIEKPYIDPRRVRMEVRRTMGLLGDMAPLIGKPIEGLTLPQAEVLSKEFKKRQATLKKKVESQTPEKESIRNRLRRAKKELYDQLHPDPNAPKPIIADASYRSPYCVPPPPHILQAMQEYARAAESFNDQDLVSESDDQSEDAKSEKTLNTPVFPISVVEFRKNKLCPIPENRFLIPEVKPDDSNQQLKRSDTKNSISNQPSTPQDTIAQPKSTPKRLLSRPDSSKTQSPSRPLETPKSSPIGPRSTASPSESAHPKLTPRPSETASSRLRRERSSQAKSTSNQPFGFSKSTSLKPIPNAPVEPIQKSERKPYIDYLRQKVTGKSSEKKS